MENLVKELMEKANLNEEQATKSIEVLKDYIMSQLPPMMHPMIDNFLSGGGMPSQSDF